MFATVGSLDTHAASEVRWMKQPAGATLMLVSVMKLR
jgi:hypothetical protein